GLQRVAYEAAPLGPPRVVERRVTIRGEQLRQAVLEPVAGLVREGKIVGIGADADDAVGRALAAGGSDEQCEADRDGANRGLPRRSREAAKAGQCSPPIENTYSMPPRVVAA